MSNHIKTILAQARQQKKAIAAFNVSSIEAIQAVFETAGELNVPVILETSKGEAEHLTPELLYPICEQLSNIFGVMYALHLDRANDMTLIKRCLDAGYSSIASEPAGLKSYKETVEQTLKIREITRSYNAALEGAIEVVPLVYYASQDTTKFTDPATARQFVAETGIDSLVISIGTQSGKYKQTEMLRWDILEALNGLLPEVPFVLHGGSFLTQDVYNKAIELGVAKININSELRLAYTEQLKQNLLAKPDEYAPYRLLTGAKEAMKAIVRTKLIQFNHI